MNAPEKPRITTVFKNGGSQAVRIPAEFRLSVDQVLIERDGDTLLLRPVKPDWADFFADPRVVPEDFLADGRGGPPQDRDSLSC